MEIISDLRDNDLNLMKATELRLGLPGTTDEPAPEKQLLKSNKRSSSEMDHSSDHTDIDSATASKAQIIGWPPVRSHRKNILQQKNINVDNASEKSGMYVKVSMDGAPYLRKIDLRIYKSYMDLHKSLEIMLKCSINGGCYEMFGCINNRSGEYVPTYQDKDGDWMMVGDVPWDMFVSSCTRLRIMKGFQANGL